MPTILRVGSYRFYFYSSGGDEPMHVHVQSGDNVAKFWLAPVLRERSGGFAPAELRRIETLVSEHQLELMEAWNAHFNG